MRKGGGGSGTQKVVYQKWPDKTFPIVNFPTMVTLVWGVQGGVPPSSYGVRPCSYFPG